MSVSFPLKALFLFRTFRLPPRASLLKASCDVAWQDRLRASVFGGRSPVMQMRAGRAATNEKK